MVSEFAATSLMSKIIFNAALTLHYAIWNSNIGRKHLRLHYFLLVYLKRYHSKYPSLNLEKPPTKKMKFQRRMWGLNESFTVITTWVNMFIDSKLKPTFWSQTLHGNMTLYIKKGPTTLYLIFVVVEDTFT